MVRGRPGVDKGSGEEEAGREEEGSGLRTGRERGAVVAIEKEGNPRRRGRSGVW